MADLKRTRRVIFNESDFSITNSPISAFCRTYCQGICNAFNREFGTNYTPEQLSAQSATQQIWGFPLFDYDGSISDKYYFAISGSGNNYKLGMAIYLKENDEIITDLVQPAVNLYTGSSSYLNLPFYSNNYSYTAKIYNGFLIFSPIPNGYSFGGLCYTGTDSSVKEDIQNNGVPAETFLFQKVSDYSGNTYTGILKFESASNTGINALSYVVDGLFKTKKIIPYEIQAQLSSAYRDETIACRIMDKFVKFDVYICSIKNTYGNIKDFYTISNHTGSENPLVNIYNKNDNKYITTLPTVARSEKWAMLIKGVIPNEYEKYNGLPFTVYGCLACVCDNKIFVLGGGSGDSQKKFYSFDGKKWEQLPNLPFTLIRGSTSESKGTVITFDNKINVFTYTTAPQQVHRFIYNGSNWSDESTYSQLPTVRASATDNNSILIMRDYRYGKVTGSMFQYYEASSLHSFLSGLGILLYYNNEYYFFKNKTLIKQVQNNEWTIVTTIPSAYVVGGEGSYAVVYRGAIHVLGGGGSAFVTHVKWDGTEWTQVSTLPEEFNSGCAVVYRDEIHIMGTRRTGYISTTGHWRWNGTEWKKGYIND